MTLVGDKVKTKCCKKQVEDDVLKQLNDRDLGELKNVEEKFDVHLTVSDIKYVIMVQNFRLPITLNFKQWYFCSNIAPM